MYCGAVKRQTIYIRHKYTIGIKSESSEDEAVSEKQTLLSYNMEHDIIEGNKESKIEDIELLLKKISRNLPSVTYLSLLGNKACPNQLSDIENDDEDYQRYRYYVLYHLPKLKFLDSSKVTELERFEAKSRGQLMKIVKPKPGVNPEEYLITQLPSPYSPLPRVMRNPHDHKGIELINNKHFTCVKRQHQ
ncbi:leucine-rich melanocyte differentiation-associated protein [Holotrichia oblita]|uniref:Leucine-rich melanocyte differentiation-associated protein n=2 Tax=Holotrichia oblita TaxID=644536 RepID=A0ACB9T088_HOLOL|nr:leucine-rich melanocyte differentiation-associated protein [Holotrichia oblita]KAI4460187.1 leucine-rich melanocyte differentiation-associated protein [Holotrichia oblita]